MDERRDVSVGRRETVEERGSLDGNGEEGGWEGFLEVRNEVRENKKRMRKKVQLERGNREEEGGIIKKEEEIKKRW